LIAAENLSYATRSAGEMPEGNQVYLADTLGELGNWFALTDVIFLGGSLKPIGGHNPFEVALAGSGVLSGPEVFNFSETYAEMDQAGAVRFVRDAEEIAEAVAELLSDRQVVENAGRAARAFVRGKSTQVQSVATRLCKALDLEEHMT
jgi:3-deoxy-D-manno-octulosonic-acid transferase